MSLISEDDRVLAVQNLLSLSTRPGRRWYAYWCVAQAIAAPVLIGVGMVRGLWWAALIGVVMLIGPSAWAGWLYGNFTGATDVATTAVDQLIAHATLTDDPASTSMLNSLKTGRQPLRRIK